MNDVHPGVRPERNNNNEYKGTHKNYIYAGMAELADEWTMFIPASAPKETNNNEYKGTHKNYIYAGMAELADARDLKSLDGNIISVRARFPAPRKHRVLWSSIRTRNNTVFLFMVFVTSFIYCFAHLSLFFAIFVSRLFCLCGFIVPDRTMELVVVLTANIIAILRLEW